MAEAFPDEHEFPDDCRMISVLLFATKWQFDTYGLSTVNKSLVNNLRLVDPDFKTIKITCAVVEEEGKIKETDLIDARKYGVELRGAKRPKGSKRGKRPKLQWLDKSPGTNYHHLVQEESYDFIIGHAPFLGNGCFNLKGYNRNKKKSPKVILIFHALPKDENGGIDDEILLDWLTEADIVFSLGKTIDDELLPYIASLDHEKRPVHHMYLPSYPLELFAVKQDYSQGKVRGTQNVCMMSEEIKNLDINGLDFPLAVTATAGASEHIRDFDGVRINLSLLAANEEDKSEWQDSFEEVISRRNLKDTGLSFQTDGSLTLDKIKVHMRKSNLSLLPLKQNCPPFGTEALTVIAAGVPVLVSEYSGLASLLRTMVEDEPVVYKNKMEVNTETWKDRIIPEVSKT